MNITNYFPSFDTLYFNLSFNADFEHTIDRDGDVEIEVSDNYYGGSHDILLCNIEELRELVNAWDNRETTHPDQLELF